MQRKTYTLTEAQKKLERYCAYQERCHRDVTTKLKEMHMIPEAIDNIVSALIQDNYLNEERFARSYARGKFNIKKWGRNRIVNELKQRNISRYNIKAALSEIDPEQYHETLDTLVEKKWASLTDTDLQKKKRKLLNYLLYRGWESQYVYEKIQSLEV
ncbi:regulatory protein RecX [Spongiimicrobium salis]|uniref:regulatory protein RecX n=1 Tax=Spongiimicrobium salis TaxID=1667022 RepID=UPI00374D9097